MKNVFLLGIVEPDPSIRERLRDVFLKAGYRIEIATNAAEAMTMFDGSAAREFDLIITEYALSDRTGLDIIHYVRTVNPGIRTLLMTSYDVNSWIEQAIADDIGSIIAKTKPLEIDELLLATRALLTGDIFGLEQHLHGGTGITDLTIAASSDKEAVISRIADDAAKIAVDGENARDVVALVLDEMINNALYGAPRTQQGSNRYAKGSSIRLEPDQVITVRFGTDGALYGFSVTDRHGTLRRIDVLEALARQVKGEGLDDDYGGGGFYLIRSFIDRLVINIDKNRRTEIIGLLHLPLKRDVAEQRNKSLLIFQTYGEKP